MLPVQTTTVLSVIRHPCPAQGLVHSTDRIKIKFVQDADIHCQTLQPLMGLHGIVSVLWQTVRSAFFTSSF